LKRKRRGRGAKEAANVLPRGGGKKGDASMSTRRPFLPQKKGGSNEKRERNAPQKRKRARCTIHNDTSRLFRRGIGGEKDFRGGKKKTNEPGLKKKCSGEKHLRHSKEKGKRKDQERKEEWITFRRREKGTQKVGWNLVSSKKASRTASYGIGKKPRGGQQRPKRQGKKKKNGVTENDRACDSKIMSLGGGKEVPASGMVRKEKGESRKGLWFAGKEGRAKRGREKEKDA